jgi:hypothetical protein
LLSFGHGFALTGDVSRAILIAEKRGEEHKMDLQLTGKRALVTGSSAGLGAESHAVLPQKAAWSSSMAVTANAQKQ